MKLAARANENFQVFCTKDRGSAYKCLMRARTFKLSEAAAVLGLSPSTLYQLVASKRIAHLRIGTGRGAIRFTENQIQDYLDSCFVESASTRSLVARKLKHLQVKDI